MGAGDQGPDVGGQLVAPGIRAQLLRAGEAEAGTRAALRVLPASGPHPSGPNDPDLGDPPPVGGGSVWGPYREHYRGRGKQETTWHAHACAQAPTLPSPNWARELSSGG